MWMEINFFEITDQYSRQKNSENQNSLTDTKESSANFFKKSYKV